MLTVRERLRGGGDDVILAARAAGRPIFSMKSAAQPSVIKAIRSLAGVDPSPLSLRDASAAVRRFRPLLSINAFNHLFVLQCNTAVHFGRFNKPILHAL